jgi:hypothetical protein
VVFIKKMSIVFLTVCILMTSLFILPQQKAEALALPNIKQAMKILRGIGEKVGITWNSASLGALAGYLVDHVGAEDDPQPILPHWMFWGTTPDTLPIDDTYSLDLLSPDDFKGGVDLLKQASDYIQPGALVNNYGCVSMPSNFVYQSGYFYTSIFDIGHYYVVEFNNPNLVWVDNGIGVESKDGAYTFRNFWSTTFGGAYTSVGSGNVAAGDILRIGSSFESYVVADSRTNCNAPKVIGTGDIINITNVNNNIFNSTVTNYNYYTNYPVKVVNNDNDYGVSPGVPINDVIPVEDQDNIYPPDDDHDGIPNGTDITPGGETPVPDDTGIFAKLFPVLLIVKLFGVLGSCLMYLVRMFQFIMTIPGIDAIPIDNDAFVWFRSAQIVGIKIYDVVSSLAGVGLSFIVFRAIRRAYL